MLRWCDMLFLGINEGKIGANFNFDCTFCVGRWRSSAEILISNHTIAPYMSQGIIGWSKAHIKASILAWRTLFIQDQRSYSNSYATLRKSRSKNPHENRQRQQLWIELQGLWYACWLEWIFRAPSNCQLCSYGIVGRWTTEFVKL